MNGGRCTHLVCLYHLPPEDIKGECKNTAAPGFSRAPLFIPHTIIAG